MAEFLPDACTYNILNRACAAAELIHGARELYDEMLREEIRPTATTFGTLVSSLVMSSRLEAAFRHKEQMIQLNNIKLSVHIRIVDKGVHMEDGLACALGLEEKMASDRVIGLDTAVYMALIHGFFQDGRKGRSFCVGRSLKANNLLFVQFRRREQRPEEEQRQRRPRLEEEHH
ncbi:hypothetical protein KSP39_PZI009644 [Platanthera zijinensis]|uniref:Pentatricopeptide repeat-containing protein n=1 Tax=Platanthera zijinensis TaxID=2320716 RepID=A0AAP0G7H6_9ASPA